MSDLKNIPYLYKIIFKMLLDITKDTNIDTSEARQRLSHLRISKNDFKIVMRELEDMNLINKAKGYFILNEDYLYNKAFVIQEVESIKTMSFLLEEF